MIASKGMYRRYQAKCGQLAFRRIGSFREHGARGFSIIEVLITLVILSFGLIALAKFQGTIVKESSHAKNRAEASNFAQAKLEEFRNYQTLAVFDALVTHPEVLGEVVPTAGLGMNQVFRRKWTVAPGVNSKTVTMQVSWPDTSNNYFSTDNKEYTVEIVTIIARLNPAKASLLP